MNNRTVLASLFCLILLSTSVTFAAPKDIQRHWSGSSVNTLLEKGIIMGYPDGSFRPDSGITREEASVVLACFIKELADDVVVDSCGQAGDAGELDEDGCPEGIVFNDVEDYRWSYEAISFLVGNRIISGYPNDIFNPRGYLTREEFATMIYNCFNQCNCEGESIVGEGDSPIDLPQTVHFKDISGSYASEKIIKLSGKGIINGYKDGSFKPKNTVTRGEVATVLFKLSGWLEIPPSVEIPEKMVIEVPYISQLYPVSAVVGCEGTSLLSGLHSKGYALNVGLKEFLDGMPKHPSNPAKGFVGSPYVADKAKKTRTTIFPAKLTEYARAFGKVDDISGSGAKVIQGEIAMGNPVVVYVTMWWEKPYYRTYNIEGSFQTLLSNNHAVLVCGYDYKNGHYYISDPYNSKTPGKEYKYWIDGNTFEKIYDERRQAIAVR
ncbi:MAG: S-layer homology domain-containing protein [Anaerovoracaceae bacterium]